MPARAEVLGLYRRLLRGSRRTPVYNFREYALRRTRDGFHAARDAPPAQAQLLFEKAARDLRAVEHQAVIQSMYAGGGDRLVIEEESKN